MKILDRPYDCAYTPEQRREAHIRRDGPTGMRHKVSTKTKMGKIENVYPWDNMMDGDFFVVPIGKRSKRAMTNTFYQAAARHDMEIKIESFNFAEGQPGLSVTRVIGNLHATKLLAKYLGAEGVTFYDVARRNARDRNHRKGQNKELKSHDPALIIGSMPEIPKLPMGTRERRLSEIREKAQRELLGMDDDEEDFMGETK